MKLHLPKLLLTAVLAACVTPSTWAALTINTETNVASDGSWSKTFDPKNTTYLTGNINWDGDDGDNNRLQIYSHTSNTLKGNVVIGNGKQLFLQAWNSNSDYTVNNIYVGRLEGIRVGMNGAEGRTITLNNIYVTGNSSIYEHNDNKTSLLNITGTVTDKVPTDVDGNAIRTNSSLDLKGAKYNITATVDLTGLIISDNADVTFAKGSKLTLGSTLNNKDKAKLTLEEGCTFKVEDLSGFDAIVIGDTLTDGVNGYRIGEVQRIIINGSETSTITINEKAVFEIAGTTEADLLRNGNQLSVKTDETTGTIYEIHNTEDGAVVYDSAAEKWASTTGIQMDNGTALTLNTALADKVGVTLADSANVDIQVNKGVTHKHSLVSTPNSGKVSYTLDGAILNIDTTATNISAITLTNKSTVKMPGAGTSLGTANSLVQISMSGDSALSFENGSSGNVYADITIDGAAKLLGSYQGNNLNVRGTISGSGTLTLGRPGDGKNNAWTISSIISDKSTTEKLSIEHTANVVTLSGANTYSGGTTISGGTLKTTHENALGQGNVTVNGGNLEIAIHTDNAEEAAAAKKIGALTLGAGKVTISDGSYYFAKGISITSGKKATLINNWDKNQFLAGLNGDSTTELEFSRPLQDWGKENYRTLVLTAAGEFSGKLSLVNNANDNNHGITVTSAANGALKDAVIDFSTSGNSSVLVFSDKITGTDGTMLDGAVGGLSGEKGIVYAKALTINTAKDKEYTFSGSIESDSLTISGSGKQTLTQSYDGSVFVTGGELLVSGENAIAGNELSITNGTVTAECDNGNSVIKKGTEVNINTGGTLHLKGHDTLSWNVANAPEINLESTDSTKKATLKFEDTGSSTLASTINMNGNAQITGNKINTLGTSLAVTKTGNEISVETLELRNLDDSGDWNISVAEKGELTIASELTDHGDGKANINKSGAGKLIITGTESTWSGDMNVTRGTLQLKDNATLGLATVVMNSDTTLETGTGTIAALTLNAGSKLVADTAVSMDGALTLGGTITLNGGLLTALQSLEAGETLELFTNVSSLVLDGAPAPYTKGTDILDATTAMDLSNWFTLTSPEVPAMLSETQPAAGSGYYLGYNAEGTVYVGKVIPEPTTATLSLLALAGLAARRRRK